MTKLFLYFFLSISVISFGQNDKNNNKKSIKNSNHLKILSWNIYMLPSIANLSKQIKKSDKKDRAKQISKTMIENEYDIIVFQEAFHQQSRKILAKNLKDKYPFQYGPINKSGIKTNSGIFIVSKIELELLATTKYNDCSGIDCWAKKGSGLFEGKFNGNTFQILGTHLDSGNQEKREMQYRQLYSKLIKPNHTEGVAQLLCGDFNTRKSKPERYQSMLKNLDAIDITTTSKQINTTVKNTGVIDYILLRKNGSNIKVIEKSIRIFKSNKKNIEKLNGTLSDHLAVELIIAF